jgi:competence protein ComEC
MAWALLPPAWSSRNRGWLLILPALCWRPDRPAPGEWTLSALDVGQGGAIVLQTARHTLLFDAGPWHRNGTDAAQRVVLPYLRASGIKRIDTLVLSHSDLDHAGGAHTLLQAVAVERTYAAFDLQGWLRRDFHLRQRASAAPLPNRVERCGAGQGWTADGVQFRFVHPDLHPGLPAGPRSGAYWGGKQRRSNEAGCVLLVQGSYHAALLPGDVGTAQERDFAGILPPVDVVIAPHHGSATSSGSQLVQATQPAHVIAQLGYLNRFRHPSAAVERRWRRAGAAFWRTDRHGAVLARSATDGLRIEARRDNARRYWHGR